jgi:putative transposase
MKEWQSLAHTKWECKYHVVIVPKYRKKVLYGRIRDLRIKTFGHADIA